jgi:exocyst complex component 1
VENQLEGADDLNIRKVINSNYERIVSTMFDCLQQMAKMDGEGQGQGGEGKDQLNYHVILIGESPT